jgi:hypothetical protein
VASLREAVDTYRTEQKDKLDPSALKLLARLADSCDAGKAFGRLKLKDRQQEAKFLTVCILVEQLALTFPALILAEQKMPTRMKRLDKSIADLRRFVAEQTTPPSDSDLLTVWIGGKSSATVAAMTHGLDLIARLIELRRQIANNIVARLGATRKMHPTNASIIAAVQNLADGVRALTNKPHGREVADLAPVILGSELPDKSVAYALRVRKQPLWPLIAPVRDGGHSAEK